MQIHKPFKKGKSESPKNTSLPKTNKKKPPVIHNISKPMVNHSFTDLPLAAPEKENETASFLHIPEHSSEPVTKTYITENFSESDYSYHDMPQISHNREHFSQLEDTSRSILKAYHQEKKTKKNIQKAAKKKAKTEHIEEKESKTPFYFLMSKDITDNSANINQTVTPKASPEFSITQGWKRFTGNCKNSIQTLYSKIYDFLSKKHIAKEFFWTGSIVVVCIIIVLALSSRQKHNMIFFSLSDNTIHLANAGQLAAQYDVTSTTDSMEDDEYYDDYEDDYEDWEDDEYYDDYEDWEDDEYYDDYEDDYEDWEDDEYYDDYEDDYDDSSFTESDTLETEEDTDSYSDSYNEEYISPIDFDYLQKNDADVYAWIYVPGTGIDDPIIQNDIDDYYSLEYALEDDYYDEDDYDYEEDDDDMEDFSGYVYTENITSTDFTDNNTTIYGHNMENGTIFSDLQEFLDNGFFQEFDTIYVYTPEKEMEYTIFAAYLFQDIDLANTFDFSDKEIYGTYLSKVLNMSSDSANIRKNVSVTANDQILTLVTTYSEDPEQRVYLQAVLNTTTTSN